MNADIAAVTCAYLRDTPMVAQIVGARIGTRTPSTTAEPWVRVTLIDERVDGRLQALHLTRSSLQIDCYAGEPRDHSQAEASLLARTVRAALAVMHLAAHDGAVVTRASLGSLQHSPDDSLAPARERYILGVEVNAHP